MPLTHHQIIEILNHLADSRCEEFHLDMDGVTLTLRRPVGGTERPRQAARPDPAPVDRPTQPAAATEPDSAPITTDSGRSVLAPMAGTFYRKPSPDEPPFVEVGDRIEAGAALCMIEVMKLFSTLYAEFAGRVDAILVQDGQAVGQDQPLLVIEPDAG